MTFSAIPLKENHTHIWQAHIPSLARFENELLQSLSLDEVSRANRFRFPVHRLRFIIARGILRRILSLYTQEPIEFIYGPKGKPFLNYNKLDLQFNVSHSEDLVVYAVGLHAELGIDIEMIGDKCHFDIAQRYFSEDEYKVLMQFPEKDRRRAFYSIWAAKEAIIKAFGEGLHASLQSFTVSQALLTYASTWEQKSESSSLILLPDGVQYFLTYFPSHPDYQSAVAVPCAVEAINYFQYLSLDSYKLLML